MQSRDGFHVSIGWTLQEPNAELLKDIATAVRPSLEKLQSLIMKVDVMKVKIGNAVNVVRLARTLN